MTFHIFTIFSDIFSSYFNESILKRAQKKGLIKIKVYDIREFTKDKHRTTDSSPYGGGAGMVMKVDVVARAVASALKSKIKSKKLKIVLFSVSGRQFNQSKARELAKKYTDIVLICGHYEGVDERVKKIFKAEEISIGPYILTGGELPAMAVVDAVSRHIGGVLGKKESLEEIKGSYPVYTRPEIFAHKGRKYRVPEVLLKGDHKKISEWRRKNSRTKL